MNCEFLTPKTYDGNAPASSTDFWQYSEMVCTSTETELIQNSTTGAEFFIRKSISYGDFAIITFLTFFLIFVISKFFIDFFIPRRMTFKR